MKLKFDKKAMLKTIYQRRQMLDADNRVRALSDTSCNDFLNNCCGCCPSCCPNSPYTVLGATIHAVVTSIACEPMNGRVSLTCIQGRHGLSTGIVPPFGAKWTGTNSEGLSVELQCLFEANPHHFSDPWTVVGWYAQAQISGTGTDCFNLPATTNISSTTYTKTIPCQTFIGLLPGFAFVGVGNTCGRGVGWLPCNPAVTHSTYPIEIGISP